MQIRSIQPGEEDQLWRLFYETVRQINQRDYSPLQVQTWAPDEPDLERWRTRLQKNRPVVALEAEKIVGFADVQASGEMDQFFVHHNYQGQGVGKALMAHLEATARQQQIPKLWANVSETAKPFFERQGFVVITPQDVTLKEVVFRNYRMEKMLD